MHDPTKPRTAWDRAYEAQEAKNDEFRGMLKDIAIHAIKRAREDAQTTTFDVDETYERTAKRTGVKIKTLMQEQVLELLEDFFDIPDPSTYADNQTGDTRY